MAKEKFAVIETGGKQYKVEEGTILDFEKLDGEPSAKIKFETVLLVNDGGKVTVGQPTVQNAKVEGTILNQIRGDKKIVFKFKNKTGYKKTQGHRQSHTTVKIEKISLSAAKKATKAKAEAVKES